MKRLSRNFKGLSAKQIKTYAAVLLMATFSFEAFASDTEAEGAPNELAIAADADLSDDIVIESWMITPFVISTEEQPAMEMYVPGSFEIVIESELALEDWMIVPFETASLEQSPMDNSKCAPAP